MVCLPFGLAYTASVEVEPIVLSLFDVGLSWPVARHYDKGRCRKELIDGLIEFDLLVGGNSLMPCSINWGLNYY